MNDLDEQKIECTVGNNGVCFWHGKKAANVFISDARTHGIYLSLTPYTAKFKQRDYSCSLAKNLSNCSAGQRYCIVRKDSF